MPSSNQPPTSIRYLKARLRILKRPQVWGTSLGLLIVIFFVAEYWTGSDWIGISRETRPSSGRAASLDNLPSQTDASSLPSQEDSAIGIDIDSLPVLLKDFNISTQPSSAQPSQDENSLEQTDAATGEPLQQPTPSASSGLSPSIRPTPQASTISQNPFVSNQPETLNLNLPGLDGLGRSGTSSSNSFTSQRQGNRSSGISVLGLPSLTAPGAIATPSQPTPLQRALQPYGVPSANQVAPQTSSFPAGSASTEPSNTTGRLSTPIYPGSTLTRPAAPGSYAPQMSPPLGTTGYTAPPSLGTPATSDPSYTNPYTNSVRPQPIPGLQPAPQIAPASGSIRSNSSRQVPLQTQNSGLNQGYGGTGSTYSTTPNSYQQPQSGQSAPAPFSAPRSRGGGEINTFSNP